MRNWIVLRAIMTLEFYVVRLRMKAKKPRPDERGFWKFVGAYAPTE